MKSLSAALIGESAADQSGWCELYDIYLRDYITTPWGRTDVLRLTDLPGGLQFFAPSIAPEPPASRGSSLSYAGWPLKRAIIKAEAKTSTDKMQIAASNAGGDWAAMLAAVDWYDVPIVIRKVSTTIPAATADDCAVIFCGQVDAVSMTDRMLQFECSNDLASLVTMIAPRQNMHTLCRFSWGDDLCTTIKFLAANHKIKIASGGCTASAIYSADLIEDTGAADSYGTDLVDGLANGAITASSEKTGWTNQAVTIYPSWNVVHLKSHGAATNTPVSFTADVMPIGFESGATYYAIRYNADNFKVSASLGGPPKIFWSAGTNVKVTIPDFSASNVKASNSSFWSLGTSDDWGDKSQGYYLIPDSQAGLANAALKPYIQFDFGVARSPKVWQLRTPVGVGLEELVRTIVFFSSPNASTWTHEGYFEVPPRGGVYFDALLPNASSARYWRICIRNRWAVSLYYKLLEKVRAYEGSRNYWRSGLVVFLDDCQTESLRGVARPILSSFLGGITIPALPAVPIAGDSFTISRGCSRTFNDCCARYNWENFGGFLDLPFQAIIR